MAGRPKRGRPRHDIVAGEKRGDAALVRRAPGNDRPARVAGASSATCAMTMPRRWRREFATWWCAAHPPSAVRRLTALRWKPCGTAMRQARRSPVRCSHGFEVLAASRPTAVNLFWALKRMRLQWESLAAYPAAAQADALLAQAHRDLRGRHPRESRHGRTRRGAAGRRRARAHALQCRRAGDGGPRHGARCDSLGGRGGQAHFRHRRRNPAVPAGCAPDGLGDGAGSASRSPSSPTTWPAS